jgi:hypothetical protein
VARNGNLRARRSDHVDLKIALADDSASGGGGGNESEPTTDPNPSSDDDQIGYAAAPLAESDVAIACVADEKTNRESVDEVKYFDYYSSYYRDPGFSNDSEPMAGFEPATYGLRRPRR